MLSPENLAHEKMRKEHRLGTLRLAAGWQVNPAWWIANPGFAQQYFTAEQTAMKAGDFLASKLPKAAIIQPPIKN